HGHQQGIGIDVDELALGLGQGFGQPAKERLDGRFLHGRGHGPHSSAETRRPPRRSLANLTEAGGQAWRYSPSMAVTAKKMGDADQEPLLFDAVLYPHRSL